MAKKTPKPTPEPTPATAEAIQTPETEATQNTNADALVPVTDPKLIAMVDPDQVMRFGLRLKSYITQNKLSVQIQGKEYAMVDGWKFAGMNFGIVPMVDKPIKREGSGQIYFHKRNQKDKWDKPVQVVSLVTRSKEVHEQALIENPPAAFYTRDEYTYECSCKLISLQTGKEVGSGHAVCSNTEAKKLDFDEYAIASMAQTRAIGKAFRNLIGYVMNAAGYETTPAEEMQEEYTQERKKQDNGTAVVMATQAQIEKIEALLANKCFTPEYRIKIEDAIHAFTLERAGKCIEFLEEQIKKGGKQ